MCGFIAQLVEHRTGIAEVMGSNPVEALIFFRLLLSNCLNWKIYCDDHTSLFLTIFVCSVFNLNNKNVNALIARELSGFTCTRSLTMNSKFSIPHSATSCGIEISRSLLVNSCR